MKKKVLSVALFIASMMALSACGAEQSGSTVTAEEAAALAQTVEESTASLPSGNSDLTDGVYYTILIGEEMESGNAYIKSAEFHEDSVVIEATFKQMSDEWEEIASYELDRYTFAVNEATTYLAGGGEGDPQYMDQAEFVEFLQQVMDSGLGLEIRIENGYATQIGIWS